MSHPEGSIVGDGKDVHGGALVERGEKLHVATVSQQ